MPRYKLNPDGLLKTIQAGNPTIRQFLNPAIFAEISPQLKFESYLFQLKGHICLENMNMAFLLFWLWFVVAVAAVIIFVLVVAVVAIVFVFLLFLFYLFCVHSIFLPTSSPKTSNLQLAGEYLQWLLQQQLCRSPQRKQRLYGILGVLDLTVFGGAKSSPKKNGVDGGLA